MSKASKENQQVLIDRFVASLEKSEWRPLKVAADYAALEGLLANLPGRLPPLFELLLLSYRWAQVDVGLCELIANPPGPDLMGFLKEMSRDRGLWESLRPASYVQFGKGYDYDPICFDMSAREKNGERKIVKISHEEILCNYRVKVVAEIAPTFEQFVVRSIEALERRGRSR
jgi:hypothetical protein